MPINSGEGEGCEAPDSTCLNVPGGRHQVTAHNNRADSFLALYTDDININGD